MLKMKKVIAACTVAGTLLLVFLLCFLIYQFVTISILEKRIDAKKDEILELTQIIEEDRKDLEYYESVFGKEWLAFQKGFVRPSED